MPPEVPALPPAVAGDADAPGRAAIGAGAGTGGARLAVVNCAIFDGESGDLRDGPVLVVDGRVERVGGRPPAGGITVDARGGVVTPGLIDAHFHAYAVDLDDYRIESLPTSYVALAGAVRLRRALRRGFTTVRDVAGGDPGLAAALAEGLLEGPRYLYTGAALSQTGGHGDPRAPEIGHCPPGRHLNEIVDGVDALRRVTRERLRTGAHAIKIMTSGGVVSPADPLRVPQYSAEEVRVVVEEATRRGSYVAAHAYSPEAIEHSIVNGVRSIEHGNLLDPPTARLMAQHVAFLVPTLIAYDALARRGPGLGLAQVGLAKNREVLAAGARSLEVATAAAVRIGFGSDLMGVLEDEQLEGLRLQSEVLGVLPTLRSATSVNADLLHRPDLGRVVEGAVADLLVFDGNPLERPDLLWRRQRPVVVRGGIPLPG